MAAKVCPVCHRPLTHSHGVFVLSDACGGWVVVPAAAWGVLVACSCFAALGLLGWGGGTGSVASSQARPAPSGGALPWLVTAPRSREEGAHPLGVGVIARRQPPPPPSPLALPAAATAPATAAAAPVAAAPTPSPRPGRHAATEPLGPAGLPRSAFPGVTIVNDERSAERALAVLNSPAVTSSGTPVAWDTETEGVNPKVESPVGAGSVICATAYAGAEVDFGAGPHLWVDNTGPGAALHYLRDYLEDATHPKVWHNYSFDRAVLANGGIDAAGFAGDTMHMGRLECTARLKYSLGALGEVLLAEAKRPMEERFGVAPTLKSGAIGKMLSVPSPLALQTDPATVVEWVDYATHDAALTLRLYKELRARLKGQYLCADGSGTLWDLYTSMFVPFGEMLTDMERVGFAVDLPLLRTKEADAVKSRVLLEDKFRRWASAHCPDARYMNVHSDRQLQQLLFGGHFPSSRKGVVRFPKEHTFAVDQAALRTSASPTLAADAESFDGPGDPAEEENSEAAPCTSPTGGRKPKRDIRQVTLVSQGFIPTVFTKKGYPSANNSVLRQLAGSPSASPPVYGGAADPEACEALESLCEARAVSHMITSFLNPLQLHPDADGRIHASLNINTETGRLSCRRPNLQNQPALEKDLYKVRSAFTAAPGNALIVADYGQLELRLLAHLSGCTSMLDAFAAGGDFHSRTAVSMYPHVAAAVANGTVRLEAESAGEGESGGTEGAETVPLLKDAFGMERRRAKTLNFSIAYGKTTNGLAKDWGISVKDATETVTRWYSDRFEVRAWQESTLARARETGYVETLLGRRRHLPDMLVQRAVRRGGGGGRSGSFDRRVAVAHAERAAINAPLQGSAADLVMAAMLGLHAHPVLQRLGWRVILQVHDEIILEGPTGSVDEALPLVTRVMKSPLEGVELSVELPVDAKAARTWYDAK